MHYCPHFFKATDTAVTGMKERFSDSYGLKSYGQLETILLSGAVVHDIVKQYPELSMQDLQLELAMFHRKYTCMKVSDACEILQQMAPELISIFPQVEILL